MLNQRPKIVCNPDKSGKLSQCILGDKNTKSVVMIVTVLVSILGILGIPLFSYAAEMNNTPKDETSLELTQQDERAYMGVYLDDLDFADAHKKNYEYNYGVLISGVVKDGPADKAGLMNGDIIMEFDGEKALHEDHLSSLIKSKKPGDKVEIKFFRDGEIQSTDVTLGRRETSRQVEEEGILKKELSAGWGGGSWIPVWFQPDLDDVNEVITSLGFAKLRDDGLFMNGGGGKITIGNGLMVGGMGVGYSLDRKIGYTINDTMVTRRMNYQNSYWGITLDKRLPISRKFISEIGMMLGWGSHTLEVSQTNGVYNWQDLDAQLGESANNSIQMEKRYIFLQPKVACLYKINSWFGLRAEVGYLLSHSYHSGWNVRVCDDTFEMINSPDTSYNGFTFSVGPWFGF